MHPAGLYKVEDEAALLAHLDRYPFMAFAAAIDGRPMIAHAPVVVRRRDNRLILDFHLSRDNLLAPHIAGGFHAVAVSLGPDIYVSPDWYVGPDQVPSWNYLTVEAEGPVTPMDEAGLIRHLDELSAQEEARLLPKKPWTRHKMAPGKFETLLRGILGASLTVERFEGTFKLSQNKNAADRAGVVAALGDHPIGRRMAEL
jgi:transcriptional regulator